jgi:hypothetical protein
MKNFSLNRNAHRTNAPAILSKGALLLALGCQGNGNAARISDAGAEDASVSLGPKVVGAFTIDVVPPVAASGTTAAVVGHTTVIGRVDSDSQPEMVVWNARTTQGGCTLLVPKVPFCDPSCTNGAMCSGIEAKCRSYPSVLSVGAVTATGLTTDAGSAPVTLESIGGQYQLVGVTLAYPPFTENSPVSVVAAGGDTAPFTLESYGITPLALTGSATVTMESGKPVTLTWVAASAASHTRIHVSVDISHHGGQAGEIDCDVPDTGSLQIPASLVTDLIALGVAGFPGLTITRVASDSVELSQGWVQLNIQSSQALSISIPGVISCSTNDECPVGQTCQSNSACK